MFSFYPIAGIVLSYFIGNISPAILIGKMAGIDIRNQGSGNAGSTNVLRVLGKKAAAATFVIDVLKGAVAVLIGNYIGGTEVAMACGAAAFVGHIWPLIFGFKGGKGIATAFGVIVALEPGLGLLMAAIALSVIAISRRVSVGSVVAILLLPLVAYFFDPIYVLWSAFMAVIALIKHRSNIRRLFRGEEPKISFKK
ncbi:glycerol-3-phosphate 1-O-acyltransferase PlsY [Sinanaerobacter chloroacetimidivorans]|uniref:Glycerol-3-phosphate acyltransferase n=1 Tax=Sinanaerobacter chloroacetimidivorans TaxID=2818044 RepID=A0A8J7W4L2_9FIRM|nr:glycerol-3-phosphate 1-O-acyltransferase PlsY [Sinanaerobacter chloroacetimidivorans]MBR0598850.1 glycerol-3-phosphate 1-O-acyltransferase PlsY [Sinanaerobacter chloroacetimidivorans]